MATVYGIKRKPVGKVTPHPSGAIAAQIGQKRIGLFTDESLAVMAILDLAKRPLTVEGYLALVEEPVADGAATFQIDADLM
jgi:hypothetical protein